MDKTGNCMSKNEVDHGGESQKLATSIAEDLEKGVLERRRTMSLPSRPIGLSAELLEKARSVRGSASCTTSPQKVTENDQPNSTKQSTLKWMDPKNSTIRQHYYPEGGWGWVVCACAVFVHGLTTGVQLSYGMFYVEVLRMFGEDKDQEAVWAGALSMSCGFFVPPVVVAVCRRKSTRLTAVIGGLMTALGCLFTSFASQMHQVFMSYGVFMGCGIGIVRETSNIMIGQYFKRRRELVELFVQSGTGLGIAVMSVLLAKLIRLLDWRLGLHAVTGIVFLTFFLGFFYRSASLYHPQRRAILHLKNQKRKVKDKNVSQEKIPFLDFSPLKTKTLQIIMLSTSLSSFGLYTPYFYLVHITKDEGLEDSSVLLLQLFLGFAYMLGCFSFSMLILKNSAHCMIARQYLWQASMFGTVIAILSFCAVNEYNGYVLFVFVYGIFSGGYHYSLKMYLYEKVRPRNFDRSWSYLQCSQSIPVLLGIPVTAYINRSRGPKMGFLFSCGCILAGTLSLFLMNLRRNVTKKSRQAIANSVDDQNRCELERCFTIRNSDICTCGNNVSRMRAPPLDGCQRTISFATSVDVADDEKRPEQLTCISEEGLIDLGENNLLDEWCGAECITSCNKEEKFLMISEFENNMNENVSTSDKHNSKRKTCTHPALYDIMKHNHCDDTSIPRGPSKPISIIEEVTSSV
ncbi:monocarboxylate transporter 10-like [Limulus polyphemus]|uniref:Monocarboxylate transporter 10-like n=1 Tax=Limulus polyphemus TaxID=6850 RepID=A0ABM1B4G7_LIMPO|nr:monocarboxylate transporter 10-like [Limulus polyphemus]